MINTLFFDLDGTLFDTAPEFLIALNQLRNQHHKEPITLEALRPWVSYGAQGILKQGFGITPESSHYPKIHQEFLGLYSDGLGKNTKLFEGFEEILEFWMGEGNKWGIVTNKPGWLTEPLLKNIGFWDQAHVIVSGDTVSQPKPEPDSLLYACAQIHALPEKTLYVGDAARDIEAGRRAGMKTIGALYGYIPEEEDPRLWQADYYIERPEELRQYL